MKTIFLIIYIQEQENDAPYLDQDTVSTDMPYQSISHPRIDAKCRDWSARAQVGDRYKGYDFYVMRQR